jgi:phenolic acid decarboxylase
MVYAIQYYKVYFGLYPSSGIYKTIKSLLKDSDQFFGVIYNRRWIKSKINLIVLYKNINVSK